MENEFLKRLDQSLLSYRKGVEVAERYLGPKHAICVTLKNSLVAAKKSLAAGKGKGIKGGAKAGAKKVTAKLGSSPIRGSGGMSSVEDAMGDLKVSVPSPMAAAPGR